MTALEFGGSLYEVRTGGRAGEAVAAPETPRQGSAAEEFASLYTMTFCPLVAYCRRHLAGSGEPEEVAQEAFLRAWSSWEQYVRPRPFWPWVATIARRLCIDNRRQLDRRSPKQHALLALNGETPLTPEEIVVLEEEQTAAAAAFEGLSPRQRRIIMLRDLDDWSYRQIAHAEGVTIESVRGALKRSREALRRQYRHIA